MFQIILIAIITGFAIIMLIVFVRLLVELVIRLVLALTATFAFALIGRAIADHYGLDGGLVGLGIALLTLPASIWLIWAWRGELSGLWEGPADGKVASNVVVAPVEPLSARSDIEIELGLSNASEMVAAWNSAITLAPSADLQTPRKSCATFIAAAEKGESGDPATLDMLIFIRRHVPGLVEDTRAVLSGASAEEKAELIASMVADLHELGRDCDDLMKSARISARERLQVRRARFAQRRAREKF